LLFLYIGGTVDEKGKQHLGKTVERKKENVILGFDNDKEGGYMNREELTECMYNCLCALEGAYGVSDLINTLEAVKDGEYFSIPVAGVTENYTMNFIYMSESLYTDIFGGKAEFNMMLINLSDGADETAIAEQLIATDNVLGLQFQSETSQKFKDLVDSLQYIVLVVIISAGLLAFIVLYNLVNVNVAERIREIATIKVLGFRSGETTSYITRETIVTTLMGIAVGLPIGVLLERFVVTVAEVEAVMFAPDIAAYCFLWSTLLTFGFSLIVNFTLHFQLKKIDMVESLKSVE